MSVSNVEINFDNIASITGRFEGIRQLYNEKLKKETEQFFSGDLYPDVKGLFKINEDKIKWFFSTSNIKDVSAIAKLQY